jgi:hypothetical protein
LQPGLDSAGTDSKLYEFRRFKRQKRSAAGLPATKAHKKLKAALSVYSQEQLLPSFLAQSQHSQQHSHFAQLPQLSSSQRLQSSPQLSAIEVSTSSNSTDFILVPRLNPVEDQLKPAALDKFFSFALRSNSSETSSACPRFQPITFSKLPV